MRLLGTCWLPAGLAAVVGVVVAAGDDAAARRLSPLELERALLHVFEVHGSLRAAEEALGGDEVGERLRMTSASGDRFVCLAPRDAAGEADALAPGGADSELAKVEAQLGSLRGTCLVKRLGYWSYKVCPFHGVAQIHYEGNQNKVNFDLGRYNGMERRRVAPAALSSSGASSSSSGASASSSGASSSGAAAAVATTATTTTATTIPSTTAAGALTAVAPVSAEAAWEEVEWVQSFVNGTNGRRSVMVLSCKQGIETATVTSVDEVTLHQYDVRVATPLACRATAEWQAKQLLAPLQGQCFRRAEGWWTYELCFERHLRQFHKDKDGGTDEYMLGEFGLEENARLAKAGQLLSRDKNTGRPVLQQAYSGGTHCGVRDEPRSASVHFFCAHQHNSDLASGGSPTSILSVTESPSCSYVVRVHTPLLCGHPHFREKAAKKAAMSKLHCAKDDVADAAPTKTN